MKKKLQKVIVVRSSICNEPFGPLNTVGVSLANMLAVNIAHEVGKKKVVIWTSIHRNNQQTAEIIQQHLSSSTRIILSKKFSNVILGDTPENAAEIFQEISECSAEVLIIVTHASYLTCVNTQWKLHCPQGFAMQAAGLVLQWGQTPIFLRCIAFDTVYTQKCSCWTTIKSILCTIGWILGTVLFVYLIYRLVQYLI